MHDIIYPLITVCPLCYNTFEAPSQLPFRRHPVRRRQKKIGTTAQNQRNKTGLPTLLQMGRNGGPHTDTLGILALLRYARVRALNPRTLDPRTLDLRTLAPTARSLKAALVPSSRSLLTPPARCALSSARFPSRVPLRVLPYTCALPSVRSLSCALYLPALPLP